jgi:hypothetical protein
MEDVEMEDVDDVFAPREQRMHRQFRVRDALRLRAVSVAADGSTGAPVGG